MDIEKIGMGISVSPSTKGMLIDMDMVLSKDIMVSSIRMLMESNDVNILNKYSISSFRRQLWKNDKNV